MALILVEPQTAFERPRMCRAAGTAATVTGMTCYEYEGGGTDRSTVFHFNNVAITVADLTTWGAIGTKLYDFPKGLLDIAAAMGNLTYGYTSATDANLTTGLGTATATGDANGVLTGTQVDIIPSTATAIATSAGTFTGKSSASARLGLFDGTSAAKSLYLNHGTTSDPGAGAILTVNGWIVVHWQNLGDNTIA